MVVMATVPVLRKMESEFPQDLLIEIQRLNSAKNTDCPYALIIASKTGGLGPPEQFFILSIAKIYRVGCETIIKSKAIKPAIDRSRYQNNHRRIQLIVFYVHGTDSYFMIGSEPYRLNDIKRYDFTGLSSDGMIFLHSCCVGNEFAQKMADVTGRMVLASCSLLDPANTGCSICNVHNVFEMWSYDVKDCQSIYKFQKGRPPLLCDRPRCDCALYYFGLHSYLSISAEECNIVHLNYLGMCSEKEGDLVSAKKFYLHAAFEGYSLAQYNLGMLYERLSQPDEAIFWYREASVQGDLKSERRLFILIEKSEKMKALKAPADIARL